MLDNRAADELKEVEQLSRWREALEQLTSI